MEQNKKKGEFRMDNIKKLILSFFSLIIILSMTACQNNTTIMGYTNSNESYGITLPATWIQDTGVSNGDILVLYSNEERDIIISIQQYDREIAEDTMGLNSLERFQQFYKINSIIAGLYPSGKTKEVEYNMENMKNVLAEELVSDSNDNTVAKAFCVAAESDNAYYTCIITGEQKIYNRNIDNLKEVLSALVEK